MVGFNPRAVGSPGDEGSGSGWRGRPGRQEGAPPPCSPAVHRGLGVAAGGGPELGPADRPQLSLWLRGTALSALAKAGQGIKVPVTERGAAIRRTDRLSGLMRVVSKSTRRVWYECVCVPTHRHTLMAPEGHCARARMAASWGRGGPKVRGAFSYLWDLSNLFTSGLYHPRKSSQPHSSTGGEGKGKGVLGREVSGQRNGAGGQATPRPVVGEAGAGPWSA